MISLVAPAKVNLSLVVHPPDGSGFHPISSVVQTIDLVDRLDLRPAGDRDLVEVVPAGAAPSGRDNLVAKALAAARKAGVRVPPLDVLVEKAIPAEAGLGGGSADAAGALVGAAHLAGVVVDTLAEVAARVGSDVPAMVRGGTVGVSGRGEVVVDLPAVDPSLRWLLVVPPFGLSTAAVYRAWDDLGYPVGTEVEWPATTGALGHAPRNDLEPAALRLEPRLVDWVARVSDLVGRRPMLSGSGTALFVEVDGPDAPADAGLEREARLWKVVAPRAAGPEVVSG